MSGLNCRPVTRVTGRPALLRRLRALLVAAHRFARHRATTAADRDWSIQVLDGLTSTLQAADPAGAPRQDTEDRRQTW